MVQKTVTRKATSFQKAGREAVANSKAVQRHINRVWNLGPGAPMFRKEVAKIDPETGKGIVKNGMPVVVRRSVRLIQGHAYNIACAGAVRAAVREIKDDCEKWGIPYTSNTNHPFMLGVPNGTKLMLEQFLSAYVSTGTLHATRAMKAFHPDKEPNKPKHKRLNKMYIKRSFEQLKAEKEAEKGAEKEVLVDERV